MPDYDFLKQLEADTEAYRDTIDTVDKDGKRIWLYPKKPSGRYYKARTYVSWVLLFLLFAMPWMRFNGEPFMLFNVLEVKFIIFGIYFAPQDFYLFGLAMITLVVFVTLFTAVFGRLFCGWVCPQTIFMEMLYRKIEYAIEGDANAQRRLDKAPWTRDKVWKKGLKHTLFFGIAVLIANTFLAYIIGTDELLKIITDPLSEHIGGFIAMIVFSAVFYGVFARLREQVCTTICPYGRLQSVMLDDNSINIAYDFVRGEPRGKMKKGQDTSAMGDCIDCKLCVKVCPTGIDIRNGVQLECVNCTACIDACDEVMTKIDRPLGLIRYDSHNNIIGKKKGIFTNRVKAYSAILIGLIALQIGLFSVRNDMDFLLLRTPGMLYQETEDGYTRNLYNYQIVNKTKQELPLRFELVDIEGRVTLVGQAPTTKANEITEGALFIDLPPTSTVDRKTRLKVDIYSGDEKIATAKTTFLAPPK